MRVFFSIVILVFVMDVSYASKINYEHKQLKKQILKEWNIGLSALTEMESLSNQTINEGKFFIAENNGVLLGYVYVGRIISCREGGCAKDKSVPVSENYEYFDAFFIYNTSKTIELVKVFNYRATHGHEVCSRGWLKQFIGFNSDELLEVGKTIDGLSGATISANALTDEVNYITQLLNRN